MPSRIALDDSGHVEAELAVEPGSLEVMRLHHNLAAAPQAGLVFDGLHQPRAMALVAPVGWYEEIAQMAGAAPGPAIRNADHGATGFAQEQPERFAVRNPSCFHVELIKPFF
jgi:hypothetical protein